MRSVSQHRVSEILENSFLQNKEGHKEIPPSYKIWTPVVPGSSGYLLQPIWESMIMAWWIQDISRYQKEVIAKYLNMITEFTANWSSDHNRAYK